MLTPSSMPESRVTLLSTPACVFSRQRARAPTKLVHHFPKRAHPHRESGAQFLHNLPSAKIRLPFQYLAKSDA